MRICLESQARRNLRASWQVTRCSPPQFCRKPEATEEAPTPLQKQIARIRKMLGIVVVGISGVVVAVIL
jgi:magnesium-transporting ATPase (P-type)